MEELGQDHGGTEKEQWRDHRGTTDRQRRDRGRRDRKTTLRHPQVRDHGLGLSECGATAGNPHSGGLATATHAMRGCVEGGRGTATPARTVLGAR